MTLFWIIYILGCVSSVALLYFSLDKGSKITIGEIILTFLVSTFSWVCFILFLILIYSDKVVFTKK